jgi:hypothetical protein
METRIELNEEVELSHTKVNGMLSIVEWFAVESDRRDKTRWRPSARRPFNFLGNSQSELIAATTSNTLNAQGQLLSV